MNISSRGDVKETKLKTEYHVFLKDKMKGGVISWIKSAKILAVSKRKIKYCNLNSIRIMYN